MNNELMRPPAPGRMRIAAHIRYKHGQLWEILQRRNMSIRELAEKAKISYGTMVQFVNLSKRPAEPTALAIQRALGRMGEYLDIDAAWPQGFKGLRKSLRTRSMYSDIPVLNMALAPANVPCMDTETKLLLEAGIAKLDEKERLLVEDCMAGRTLEQSAVRINRTRENVRQKFQKACGKLRDHIIEGDADVVVAPEDPAAHTLAAQGQSRWADIEFAAKRMSLGRPVGVVQISYPCAQLDMAAAALVTWTEARHSDKWRTSILELLALPYDRAWVRLCRRAGAGLQVVYMENRKDDRDLARMLQVHFRELRPFQGSYGALKSFGDAIMAQGYHSVASLCICRGADPRHNQYAIGAGDLMRIKAGLESVGLRLGMNAGMQMVERISAADKELGEGRKDHEMRLERGRMAARKIEARKQRELERAKQREALRLKREEEKRERQLERDRQWELGRQAREEKLRLEREEKKKRHKIWVRERKAATALRRKTKRLGKLYPGLPLSEAEDRERERIRLRKEKEEEYRLQQEAEWAAQIRKEMEERRAAEALAVEKELARVKELSPEEVDEYTAMRARVASENMFKNYAPCKMKDKANEGIELWWRRRRERNRGHE